MNKKLANVLALLLSFIMIVSNPMSSLAQDAADQVVTLHPTQQRTPQFHPRTQLSPKKSS